MYRWIFDPADRDALLVYVAIKKVPDYRVIVEMSCIKSPEDFLIVKRAYQIRYKRSMEEDVAAHTSGDMRKACILSPLLLFSCLLKLLFFMFVEIKDYQKII